MQQQLENVMHNGDAVAQILAPGSGANMTLGQVVCIIDNPMFVYISFPCKQYLQKYRLKKC